MFLPLSILTVSFKPNVNTENIPVVFLLVHEAVCRYDESACELKEKSPLFGYEAVRVGTCGADDQDILVTKHEQ